MNESEVLRTIEMGHQDAYDLLYDANPNYIKRFNRLCGTMKKLLDDVSKDFPDATYYTASGGFNLLLGNSHDDNGSPQTQLLAVGASNRLIIGDGDW